MSIQGTQFNQLMMELRSMQMDAMSLKQTSSDTVEQTTNTPNFSDLLNQAINKVNQTQQTSTQMASAFEMGQGSVDLSEVMVASQKASVSFQALTQVRNKLVQAYQDIMQMPV